VGPAAWRPRERLWLPSAAAAAVLLAVTAGVAAFPTLRFAYPAPGLHVAIETGIAMIALVATAIVVRGWGGGVRWDRLAIAAGLAVLAGTSAVLTTLLTVAPDSGPRGQIAIAGTLVGAALLAAGAFASQGRPRTPTAATLAVAAVALLALGLAWLPVELALDSGTAPAEDAVRPQLQRPIAVLAVQLAIALAFAAAALGFARRSGEAFARRLGLAVTFFAFAKLHYLLVPPTASDLLHSGDVLRLLFCGVLLWAAVGEVAGALALRAAERERRRIARDLHDGVAQELAFIHRRAAGMPEAAEIAVAAERALLDSRWAIERLARAPDEPLDRVLARHAGVIAARTGVAVTFSSSGAEADAGPDVREALARILGEAVANARHGRATRVHVELSTDPLRLLVVDDGTGFDPAARSHGFGLGGMRERAALVGAELIVRSGPGLGTEVAVELR
jgi:signal transduction histidine kinase